MSRAVFGFEAAEAEAQDHVLGEGSVVLDQLALAAVPESLVTPQALVQPDPDPPAVSQAEAQRGDLTSGTVSVVFDHSCTPSSSPQTPTASPNPPLPHSVLSSLAPI